MMSYCMEHFLNIMSSGVLVGILISAPMGPIGMLVIQRTLNKGRRPAFFTGMGAALSDLTYCLLTGLGMSFVTDFVTSRQMLLQIVGSVLLILFADSASVISDFDDQSTLAVNVHEGHAYMYI